MLITIFFVVLVMWLVGVVTAYTLGGLIHLLLPAGDHRFVYRVSRAADNVLSLTF
jgi:hypothetical protein